MTPAWVLRMEKATDVGGHVGEHTGYRCSGFEANAIAKEWRTNQSELETARRDLAQALAEIGRLTQERDELIGALHDAVRRPLGVVPDSAGQWVTREGLDQAEERRQQR